MKILEKEKSRNLRRQGKSISQIMKDTGFSKTSVSIWVRDIILTAEQKKNISKRGRSIESIERRRINRLKNEKNKRQIIIDEAKKDFTHISQRELKLIGIILYLGEGGKTKRNSVRISNSDPEVIKIMTKFFREICKVEELKFHGMIHTFAHANIKETEKYWSQISDIPTSRFYKTYKKPSSASLQKRKTLPFGTFDVYVNDTKLFLTIMGWIGKIKELLT